MWHWRNHRRELMERIGELMAAIDNLTAAITQLDQDVKALIAKPAGVPEAQVQAAADAVTAIDTEVKAALGTS